MRTRPIYHSSDAAIRGHVFCSFLALILHQALDEKLRRTGKRVEWADLLRDLDRLQHGEISQNGKRWQMRTEAGIAAATAFKAARVALPPVCSHPESRSLIRPRIPPCSATAGHPYLPLRIERLVGSES